MSRYARENPDEPPNHDWFAGQKRSDPNLCLRCGERPKLPPLVWGGKVVARPNLCRECEDEASQPPKMPVEPFKTAATGFSGKTQP